MLPIKAKFSRAAGSAVSEWLLCKQEDLTPGLKHPVEQRWPPQPITGWVERQISTIPWPATCMHILMHMLTTPKMHTH